MDSQLEADIKNDRESNNLLIWTIVAFLLFCFLGLFYYVKILNRPFPGISVVYAQGVGVDISLSKKKVF